MFRNVLLKDIFREIKGSLNRFLSIFAIVMLGVGFFAGVKSTSPDMKITADKYFKESNLMDIHIMSTIGFDSEDIKVIKEQKDFSNIMFSYSTDAMMNVNNSKAVVKILAIPQTKEGIGSPLNMPVLSSGRLPENSGECLLENNNSENRYTFKLGDKIILEPEAGSVHLSDIIKKSEYTIVGFADMPVYISFMRGTSNLGDGTVSCYMMIPPEDFNLSVYTDAYLAAGTLRDYSSFEKEYKDEISRLQESLEDLGISRCDTKYNEIRDKITSEIDDNKSKIEEAQEGVEELQSQEKQLKSKIQEIQSQAKQLDSQIQQLKAQAQKLQSKQAQLQSKQDQLQSKQAELQAQKDQLQAQQTQSQAQLSQLESQMAQLTQQASEAAEGSKTIKVQLAAIQAKITEAQQATAKIKTAEAQLTAQLPEIQTKITEVQDGITEGKAALDDVQSELDKLQKPKWFVQTREDNPGYNEFEQSADRLAAIASVFPVFFLLVAALVCLTTMSRMVEEQRTQLGTMKALGYSNMEIMSKYLIYSGFASLLGSIIGIAIGMRFFPRIIFNAYQDMFSLPPLIITFQWIYAAGSTLAAIICTVCVALFVSYEELRHVPATLMRPKAPKPGKRIVLEYISFLWSRMSFTSKVTSRNLLRYKARFLMTVIGIAGCGALILSGLGLNNSISAIAPKQFGEIYIYNTILSLKEDVQGEEGEKIKNQLSSDKRLNQSTLARRTVMDAIKGSVKLQIHLYVPEEPSEFKNYITLRHRTDKIPVKLGDDGVILTEKASNILGVSKGDVLELNSKEKTVQVKVTDIVENYVYHNVYMSPALYADKFGDTLSFNAVLCKLNDTCESNQNQFATDWLTKENTLAVTFTTNINKNFKDTFDSLNIMVLVMIISAGCLAFVVLYNLTNINITERLREIATIKVLGFYNSEVANYIYRENIVLTFIGVALGLVSGIFLHKFIVMKGEVDIVMFGRAILTRSFILAGALTILFSLLVNFVMYFKLKSVSMVESLKTVE